MKITFHNIYNELNINNFLFENLNANIGDDLLAPFIRLQELSTARGVQVGTVDKIPISNADAIVFIDMPRDSDKVFIDAKLSGKPMYLIVFESQMIHPRSHNTRLHLLFEKVFTWSDELITADSEKYIKINFSHNYCGGFKRKFEDKFFCCMISGNKRSNYFNELYSERLKAMAWFEKNQPDDFHLYGVGWNHISHANKYINYFLAKAALYVGFFSKRYPLYKGTVKRKKPVLEKYKFSICYENAKDIPGYITEKIFDCFFSGCVPIYLGANNIQNYVPKNCFIDKRDFDSYEELYSFTHDMDQTTYFLYLDNINTFLNSDDFFVFSSEYFSNTLINEISK